MSEPISDPKKVTEILEQFVIPSRLERLESVLAARTSSLTIVLEDIRNPHNISAVLRSADAFGVRDVHLLGNMYEYSSGISLGSERWIRVHQHSSPQEAVRALTIAGFSIVVLQPEEDSRFSALHSEKQEHPLPRADEPQALVRKLPVTALPFENKLALVFGNEHKGVSEHFVQQAQFHAYIPMSGFVESFNISVACAITLFCSSIAETEPKRRTVPLNTEEQEELRADWLKQSVRGSATILRDIDQRLRNSE